MQDFNPNSRKREDFFYPVPQRLDRAKAYLISILETPTRIRGIDLSHWNGKVDFEKVKLSGIDFVILKATEGDYFLDDTFDYNWRSSLSNDLLVMPYHFFRSNVKGAPQVEWFFNPANGGTFIEDVEGKTVLWWDVETEDATAVSTRQSRLFGACTNTVSKGVQAGYYSSPYKWQTLMGNPIWTNDFLQWVAHWSNVSYPTLPVGWTQEQTKVWQNGIYPTYSWVEPVEGVPSSVDHNYFFGSVQDLRDLLGFVAPTPPNCCDDVEAIKLELINIKSRIARLELNDMVTEDEINKLKIKDGEIDGRLGKLESGGLTIDKRISEIEKLIQQVKDVFCL